MATEIEFETIHHFWRTQTGGIDETVESRLLAMIYRDAAVEAIENDELFMAEELARMGRQRAEEAGIDQTPFYQLQSLALARSGSTNKAYELLLRLSRVAKDQESGGLLARAFKDLGWASSEPEVRKNFFIEAFRYAKESYERNSIENTPDRRPNYYNAIQAAQFSFFTGDQQYSDDTYSFLAKAESECRFAEEIGQDQGKDQFWIEMTRAEIALLRKNIPAAERHYTLANQLGEPFGSDLRACWKVARQIIAHHNSPETNVLLPLFRSPPAIVFSGHQFDIDRRSPRFPISEAGVSKRKILAFLKKARPRRVFTSFSLGADLLLLEAAIKLKLPITLVLAYDLDHAFANLNAMLTQLRNESAISQRVQFNWKERAEAIFSHMLAEPEARKGNHLSLRMRPVLHQIGFPRIGSEEDSAAYAYANDLMLGMAILDSEQHGSETLGVVIDAGQKGQIGGTTDFLETLHKRTNAVSNLYSQ